MKRVAREVEPSTLRELLGRPSRAHLAFTDGSWVDAVPVTFHFAEERYHIGLSADVVPRIAQGARVTLLLDAGWYWYELRAIRLRGTLRPAAPPAASAAALAWFEVVPRTVVAWDYGSLREVEGDGSG